MIFQMNVPRHGTATEDEISGPEDIWATCGASDMRRAVEEYLLRVDVNTRRRLRRRFKQRAWVSAFAAAMSGIAGLIGRANVCGDDEFESYLARFLRELGDGPEEAWLMAIYYLSHADTIEMGDHHPRFFDRCGMAHGKVERMVLTHGPLAEEDGR